MITAIITLLSSGAFGSFIGLIGGYFNRRLDLEQKKSEYEHELAKMDKDLEYMKAEYEQKTRVATIEGETAVDVAGYAAMQSSYSYAPVGDTKVDILSKLIRPLITIAFFFFSVYVFIQVSSLVSLATLDKDTIQKIYITCIEWILFQAGVSLGWWFAMRPGKVAVRS